MNLLTPAALEAAVDMVRDMCPCSLARKEAEALFLSAFNAAIARLIEEGRAGTADGITGPCILIRTGEP